MLSLWVWSFPSLLWLMCQLRKWSWMYLLTGYPNLQLRSYFLEIPCLKLSRTFIFFAQMLREKLLMVMSCGTREASFTGSFLDLWRKGAIIPSLMGLGDTLCLERNSRMKTLSSNTQFLDCYQWLILAKIRMGLSFSSLSSLLHILMENTLFLVKFLMEWAQLKLWKN